MIRYSQSACQPSRRCSQRCILFSQTVPWTKSSNIHSLAFQRSPTASHIASRWPSPLYYTEPTRMFSPFMRINPYKLCSGTTFRSFYLKNHVTSQPHYQGSQADPKVRLQPSIAYLESSHRGPRWECFVLCLQSSGIVLSVCQPEKDSKQSVFSCLMCLK